MCIKIWEVPQLLHLQEGQTTVCCACLTRVQERTKRDAWNHLGTNQVWIPQYLPDSFTHRTCWPLVGLRKDYPSRPSDLTSISIIKYLNLHTIFYLINYVYFLWISENSIKMICALKYSHVLEPSWSLCGHLSEFNLTYSYYSHSILWNTFSQLHDLMGLNTSLLPLFHSSYA